MKKAEANRATNRYSICLGCGIRHHLRFQRRWRNASKSCSNAKDSSRYPYWSWRVADSIIIKDWTRPNWERALDSALQNSVRQLTEVDGCSDGLDVASLTREAELLKAMAGKGSHARSPRAGKIK